MGKNAFVFGYNSAESEPI